MKRFPNLMGRRPMLALAMVGWLSATSAQADTVWDPGVNSTLVSGFSTTSSGLAGILGELQTILAYLMGATNEGNGLVETISSINDKLAHANANGDQGWAMSDTNTRRQTADLTMINRNLDRIPDAAGCAETAYSGGRGAAAAGTAAAKTVLDQQVLAQTEATHDQLSQMAKMVLSRPNNGFCTTDDATHSWGQCSSVGSMPGADLMTTSLTQGAVAPNQQTNVTLVSTSSHNQQAAAQAVIDNIVSPLPPQELPGKAAATVKGGKYLALVFTMAARASAAADALSDMASIRYANVGLQNASISGSFGTTWSDSTVSTLYSQLFPNQVKPTVPSEWEMLRYDIFSRYADANGNDSWQAKTASFTTEDALREIARMEALSLRLQEIQIERTEDGNKILAALLGQSLQPVSSSEINAAYKDAAGASAQ